LVYCGKIYPVSGSNHAESIVLKGSRLDKGHMLFTENFYMDRKCCCYVGIPTVSKGLIHTLLCSGSSGRDVYCFLHVRLKASGIGGGVRMFVYPKWARHSSQAI